MPLAEKALAARVYFMSSRCNQLDRCRARAAAELRPAATFTNARARQAAHCQGLVLTEYGRSRMRDACDLLREHATRPGGGVANSARGQLIRPEALSNELIGIWRSHQAANDDLRGLFLTPEYVQLAASVRPNISVAVTGRASTPRQSSAWNTSEADAARSRALPQHT